MFWLAVTIISYLLLAIVTIGDAYFLQKYVSAKTFAFYIGVTGLLILVLTPFFGFPILDRTNFSFAIWAGILSSFALVFFYYGLAVFETSRIVSATGALLPIFTLLIGLIFLPNHGSAVFSDYLAFALLILGSIVITSPKMKDLFFTVRSLGVAALASLLFAAGFVLSKAVYLKYSFWAGFFWITIGQFIASVLLFIFSRNLRHEIFKNIQSFKGLERKRSINMIIFYFANKIFGAGGAVLQNVALYLAPAIYVAIVPALQGVQYVFVLIFTTTLSIKFPQVLNEVFSTKSFLQKFIATLLIVTGIVLLTLPK